MKTEKQTRQEIINKQLANAGWNVNDPVQVIQEFDIIIDPSRVAEAAIPYGGHQFSDYVLLGRDRNPLAVVEAKKTSKDAALGREQAKQYCYNIQKQLGASCRFVFTPTDSKYISGIWRTTRLARWSASPPVTTLNVLNTFAETASP